VLSNPQQAIYLVEAWAILASAFSVAKNGEQENVDYG
jgi:hypothetical protein